MDQSEVKQDSPHIDEIEKILRCLANRDAIKILLAAKVGIYRSTKTIDDLELTQRRYYIRLNELIDVGLIETKDSRYQLTTLGEICCKIGDFLDSTLSNRSYLELADKLKRSDSISSNESKRILQLLSDKAALSLGGISSSAQPVRILEKYETLASELVEQIHNAEKSIYLATYYTDSRAIEATLDAIDRGLTLSILSGRKLSITERLQVLRMILDPNIMKLYSALLNNGKVRVRVAEFPFSFCVIDEKQVILELPNPVSKGFYIGFAVQDETLARNLIETFESLFKMAKEHPLSSQLK